MLLNYAIPVLDDSFQTGLRSACSGKHVSKTANAERSGRRPKCLWAATYMAYLLSLQLGQAASFTGIVVDDFTGLPVPNTTLMIFGEHSRYDMQATENGRFRTGELDAGDYTVVASRDGFLYASIHGHLENGPDQANDAKRLIVRMIRLCTIAGHVGGLGSRPAKVMPLIWSPNSGTKGGTWKPVFDSVLLCCGKPDRGVPVDPNGNFLIDKLPPGTYALLVAYENLQPVGKRELPAGIFRYPAANQGFELRGDGSVFQIRIALPTGTGRAIEGRVELPDSRSWYWITLSDSDQPAISVATTTSDERGGSHFGELPLKLPPFGSPWYGPARVESRCSLGRL